MPATTTQTPLAEYALRSRDLPHNRPVSVVNRRPPSRSRHPLILTTFGAALVVLVLLGQFYMALAKPEPPYGLVPNRVGQALLSREATGIGVYLVFADAQGRDALLVGDVTVEVSGMNGFNWRITRGFGPKELTPLPDDAGLLAGRLGYRLEIPANTFLRTPQRGSVLTVTVDANPSGLAAFTSTVHTPAP